jgi:hypothetical protein
MSSKCRCSGCCERAGWQRWSIGVCRSFETRRNQTPSTGGQRRRVSAAAVQRVYNEYRRGSASSAGATTAQRSVVIGGGGGGGGEQRTIGGGAARVGLVDDAAAAGYGQRRRRRHVLVARRTASPHATRIVARRLCARPRRAAQRFSLARSSNRRHCHRLDCWQRSLLRSMYFYVFLFLLLITNYTLLFVALIVAKLCEMFNLSTDQQLLTQLVDLFGQLGIII